MRVARVHGGRPPPGVVDFSTPLNPLGPPPSVPRLLSEAVRAAYGYPDYSYTKLRGVLADFYGLDPDTLVPLGGAAEALTLALAAFRPRAVVTVEPTFGDHGASLKVLGIPWATVRLREARGAYVLDPDDACLLPRGLARGSLVVISNPNNPTGSLASRADLERLASCLEDSVVLVDEAFMDLCPRDESLLGRAPPNVLVARSLTKSLAIPGLRVGFLHASEPRLIAAVEAARQPWNVGSPAAQLLERLLGESAREVRAHLERSRRLVAEGTRFLVEGFRRVGLRAYESMAPFVLVMHYPHRHPRLNRELARLGVYVRDASSFHGLTPFHSRVSVRLPGDWRLVLGAFRRVVSGASVREGSPGLHDQAAPGGR